MEARELRIGNLLLHKDGFIMEIDSINEIEVRGNELGKNDPDSEIEVSLIDLSGIPLTEEWLIKFGFPNTLSTLDAGGDYEIVFERTEENKLILKSHLGGIIKEINHVHQLQNLYFALTNTELELKEDVNK